MKRKICFITSSRAEYGLLKPLLEEVRKDKSIELCLIVTGTHLSGEFGLTYREIEKDGFKIDEKINIHLNSDTAQAISKSMGFAMMGFGEAYSRIKPDLIVIHGDRFEILATAAAASVSRIPIAHISGGEVTEAVFDDAFRHAITKLSHLHFVTTKAYRLRVIQLGEKPSRVFCVGEMGLDNLNKLKLLSKDKLENEINFKFGKHNLLVTFHPATLEENTFALQFGALLEALDELKETKIIFTKAGADTGGRVINKMIDDYVSAHPDKAAGFVSLGRIKYLSAMRFSEAVVGNSSSGIVEAPSFKIATIDIGDRQKGRIKARSIIGCSANKKSISQAIKKIYAPAFQNKLKAVKNPFEFSGGVLLAKKVLKEYSLKGILKKKFYDLGAKL